MLADDTPSCDPYAFYCSPPPRAGAGGYFAATLITGGLGAAVGVGVDALIRPDRRIYRRGDGTRLTFRPAFAPRVRGAVLSMAW